MAYVFGFEKLSAWQEGQDLAVRIYEITAQFPDSEKYGLTNQLRRASISVISNLAEGAGRSSYADQAHFYQISYSSLWEILNQLMLAFRINYIDEETLKSVRGETEKLSFKIHALKNSCYGRTKSTR